MLDHTESKNEELLRDTVDKKERYDALKRKIEG
jgi:hypothetical protein